MPASTAKRATKRTGSPKPKHTRTRTRRKPSHAEISKRAYLIYLEEGREDSLQNWLRAERELTAA